ncbi:MAG: hypothetical protein FWC28_07325 [Proteobacteria bacterium]|nr:hypothetical protein [Cystobacterineae bacterium]MCL2315041.1 hypothetical protein [Pseudomonadota bacterium]
MLARFRLQMIMIIKIICMHTDKAKREAVFPRGIQGGGSGASKPRLSVCFLRIIPQWGIHYMSQRAYWVLAVFLWQAEVLSKEKEAGEVGGIEGGELVLSGGG